MITLAPMTSQAWEAWRVLSIRGYAADKVRIGAWEPEGAEARAARELMTVLPDGQATAGHEFRTIADEAGRSVGSVWLGPSREVGHGAAFVWDIVVAPEARGRGYGRAALLALEPLARELGYDAIRLHVFGDNEVARRLYRSAGYVETDVSMLKRLG
jgi:ribosomal protein S18 acetylase RimI-like enzyme